MEKGDVVAATVLAGLGIFIIRQSLQLNYMSEYGPGPGFLPLWLGVGLIALSLPLVYFAIRTPRKSDLEKASWRSQVRALAAWFGFMVAIVLLKSLGFILSFTLLTLFLVLAMDRRSPLTALSVAVAGALGFYLIFALSLGVSLPVSPWGF